MSDLTTQAKPIAVFDIDGTFIRSSLLIELYRGLVRVGVFPTLAELEIEEQYRAWRERRGPYDAYVIEVVHAFYRRVRGCSAHDIRHVGRVVAEEQRNQVYRYTRGIIEAARSTHRLVAISGSPDVVVEPFCAMWGFERTESMRLVVEDGVCTGRREPDNPVDVDIAPQKRKLLDAACVALGATLVGSVGMGDTRSDLGMLEHIATPIAFNPSRELAEIARGRGWKIVFERKDVILELSNGTYTFLD